MAQRNFQLSASGTALAASWLWSSAGAFTLAAAAPDVPQPVPFTSLAADGWQATKSGPTDLSMESFVVQRQGFNSSGTATTIDDTLYLTKRVRQVYPNNASFTTDQVAVSDYILSTDTTVGATNNSTLTSPKPIANWMMPHRLVVGDTVTWEIAAFHYFGRPNASGAGQQVACVRVRANDGTSTTAWQTVSSTTVSTLVEDANAVEVYTGDLDVSGLADGALIWLEAEVYPYIGASASVLKSEDNHTASVTQRGFSRRYFQRDTTLAAAPPFAYVASTGNDGTGVISTTAATAAASPFLTVAGALIAARTTLGATAGDFDGLVIRIVDGVNLDSPSFNTYGWGAGAVTIERDPSTARASAIVTVNKNFNPYLPSIATVGEGALVFKDVSVAFGSSYTLIGTTSDYLFAQYWNCNLDLGGFNHSSGTRNKSHSAFYGVAFTNMGTSGPFQQGTAAYEIRCIRGVSGDLGGTGMHGYLIVGCDVIDADACNSSIPTQDGHIIYGNSFMDLDGAQATISFFDTSSGDLGSIAIVQNLFEHSGTGSNPQIRLSSDASGAGASGQNGNLVHVVMIHNTVAGDEGYGRANIAYDEHDTDARSHKFICFKANNLCQLNTKGDIFDTDGTRTGNFAFVHGVGCEGTFTEDVDAAGGADSFRQSYPGIGSVIAGGDPLFTDDQAVVASGPTAGTSPGTYTLGGSSPALDLLSAPLLAYDMAGTSRGTGTQDAGAYA